MAAGEKSFFKTGVMQNRITFITGGARSGKTRYGQQQALALSDRPLYVATAKPYPGDQEFEQRVQRHIADRDDRWVSIEEPFYISRLPLEGKVVLIDCVTLWLTNFFSLYQNDVEQALQAIRNEVNAIKELKATFFIISNELGMGVHAHTVTGRRFTDLQGWANQYLAQIADQVTLMVSGLPLTIKEQL
jgi:adenosylcobinamide kinase / adenosylcobinamide-phosphate guanylyltransferase